MDETKVEKRLTAVEIDIKYIREDIKDIKENHLKNICQKLDYIIEKIDSPRPSLWRKGIKWLMKKKQLI